MMNYRYRTQLVFCLAFLLIMPLLSGIVQAYRSDANHRTILVKVIADKKYATQSDWREKARKNLEAASEGLEKVLNIKISISEYEEWRISNISDFGELTAAMVNQVDKGRADIIIGFTLERGSGRTEELRKDGLTLSRRGFMIKTYSGAPEQNKMLTYVIIHEMIHIFGGVHVFDGSIMSPVFNEETELKLDALNMEIVSITKDIDFNRGLASLSKHQLQRLARLYTRAVRLGNRETPTYYELGEIYNHLGQYEDAIDAYRQVVRRDQSIAYAWGEIGDCYRRAGKMDKAIETFKRAINKVSQKGIFYGKIAIIYYNQGDFRSSYDNALRARRNGFEVDQILWREFKKRGIS
ncbi:MAG: tetratricopeptide repeat protein [candidate division Zixibacteria bacterium]|nr:tetratricopeptide repeat protein [candidate division Zixibacteria bacterium]